jgi:hypothetical protein
MTRSPAVALEPDEPLAIVAAFDEWANLESALARVAAHMPSCYCAVLHARPDARSELCPGASEITAIEFTRTRSFLTRGEGTLARDLAQAVRHGTHTLADAFRHWVSHAQAEQLEDHVAHGRLLLWVQPVTSDQFHNVCGDLIRASSHVVEICKVDSLSRKSRR